MADKAAPLLDGGSAVAKAVRLAAKPKVLKLTAEQRTQAMPPLPAVAPVPKRRLPPISIGKATVVRKLRQSTKRRDPSG
jgi:hypothetical protein